MKSGWVIITLAAGVIGAGGCAKKAAPAPAVPVSVAQVVEQTVPIELRSFGAVEANMSVIVKSQVTGVLTVVHFAEGQEVKRGDLLVSIDARPYEAALKAAQGNLEKDEVQLKNAEKEAARQADLFKKGFASQNDYDNSVTAAESLKAAADSDKAAVENAALQVDYCSIRSPIDGILGSLYVDQGNLIKANDVAIAAINQISPVKISFTLPQQNLPSVRRYMAEGVRKVVVNIPGVEEQEPVQAALLFIDNTVDPNTGTIRLWAASENEGHKLWPGQFVNVVLVLTEEPNVATVPAQAVQNGQQGQFVYVVKGDNTAEMRPVVVERTIDSRAVVRALKAGETVVTDGHLRIVPGARVQVKDEIEVKSQYGAIQR